MLELKSWGASDKDRIGYVRLNGQYVYQSHPGGGQRRLAVYQLFLNETSCFLGPHKKYDTMGSRGARQLKTFIQSLHTGDYMIAVSADEVMGSIYLAYAELLSLGINVPNSEQKPNSKQNKPAGPYYRASIAFVARKGYPQKAVQIMELRYKGPVLLNWDMIQGRLYI